MCRLSDRDGLRSRYLLFDKQVLSRLSYTARWEDVWEDLNLSRFSRRDGNSRPDLSCSRLTRSNDIPNAVTCLAGR